MCYRMSSKQGSSGDAAVDPSTTEVDEFCSACRTRTAHVASIDFLVENVDLENPNNSRQPYRVTECLECGAETRQRATNA